MFDANIGWLLFAYVAGTVIGWWFAFQTSNKTAIEMTIDNLIEQGYLKTKGHGKDMQILKWREWQDEH